MSPADFRHQFAVGIFEQKILDQRGCRGEGPGIVEDGLCGGMRGVRREDIGEFFQLGVSGK